MAEQSVSTTNKKKIIIAIIIVISAIMFLQSNAVQSAIDTHKINKVLSNCKNIDDERENGIYCCHLSYDQAKIDNHKDFVRFRLTTSFGDKKLYNKYKGKMGIAIKDKNGDKMKVAFLPTYESVGPFNEYGCAIVEDKNPNNRNGLAMGVINDKNKLIIPVEYDIVRDYKKGLAIVSNNELFGCVSDKGKEVLPFIYADIEPFHDDVAIIRSSDTRRYGAINIKGKVIFKPKYDNLGDFKDGTAICGLYKKFSILDKKTRKEIPLYKYSSVKRFAKNNFIVTSSNGKYGIVDSKGTPIVTPSYSYIGDSKCNRAYFRTNGKNGKFGYLDQNGKEVIPAKYDEARTFSEDRAIVKLNGAYMVIDTNGKKIWSEKDLRKDKSWSTLNISDAKGVLFNIKDFEDGNATFEYYSYADGSTIEGNISEVIKEFSDTKKIYATGKVDKDGKFTIHKKK